MLKRFFVLVLVAGAVGCESQWDPWRGDGQTGLDGYVGEFPKPGDDLAGIDLAGIDLATLDAAGQDLAVAEVPVDDSGEPVDPGPGGDDTQQDPGGVDAGPDLTAPQVVSAFSTDGLGVTVRFSEPLAASTAQLPDNFKVVGGGSSVIPVLSATYHDQFFVTLTLDPSKPINPSLVYEVRVSDVTDAAGNLVDPKFNKAKIKRSVYVAIVWHQHQPFYGDAKGDQLTGPWVRKHATKDYYDMASVVGEYPDVHVTINLTAVMMTQMLRYYVDRMGDVDDQGQPLIDVQANRVNAPAFLAKYRGKTDPWVDLMLDPTPDPEGKVAARPTDRQIELYYNAPWCALSTSDQIMHFFPQYKALREQPGTSYTHDDLLLLKLMFEIAWFDPDFLNGPVTMPDGLVVDLSDVVQKAADGTFTLRLGVQKDPTCVSQCVSACNSDVAPAECKARCPNQCHFVFDDPAEGEALANRLIAENYKIMRNIVGIHKKLRYDPDAHTGQIEIATTPFYHPILPLLWDSNLARQCQPFDTLPDPSFSYPDDARAQVAKAVQFYEDLFGQAPKGMWPGEGSVAEAVVPAFTENGVKWIATDMDNLTNTLKNLMGQSTLAPCYQCQPYRVDTDATVGGGSDPSQEMAIVFRETGLSNKIGFNYQGLTGAEATADFMMNVANMAPQFGGGDRLVTIILDGENAWENYVKEHDGKGFFHALYQALEDGYKVGEVVPVTVAEYLLGNPSRNVPAHAAHDLKELEPLWAGSWIGGDFGVWVGEWEENTAWGYLLKARKALEASGLPRPNVAAPVPDPVSEPLPYAIYRAWEELYAAEGSDWFWWYGGDMTSPAGDDSPFDLAFRAHLNGMYTEINNARAIQGKPAIAVPDFAPIIQAKAQAVTGPFTTPPKIDGKEDPPDEWAQGGLFYDNDSGAIANPDDDIAAVRYGYTADALYIALEMNKDLSAKLGTGYVLAFYLSQKHIVNAETGEFTQLKFNTKDRWGADLEFVTGGAAFELAVDFSGTAAVATLNAANGSGGWTAVASSGVASGGPTKGGKVLEVKVPFTALQCVMGDPLEMVAIAGSTGSGARSIDRAPNASGKLVFEDATNLVYVTFEVDASGSVLPIDTYGAITNPPPPKGKGIVYITGNQDKLANWIPNKIGLRDDGQGGDATAGDNKWTGRFGFMPGTLIRYKYTIGIPINEAHWGGTEEFPLTERGFEVTKDPACKKMSLKDVFADRPSPTGTLGPKAKLDDCAK